MDIKSLIQVSLQSFIMSGIYFRRWTRMYNKPALKYFHELGVLTPGYEKFMPIAFNVENPEPENARKYALFKRNPKQIDQDTKLINKLFNKYPDLKYESVSRQKYEGDGFNSYSYTYAFITEQKKLMKLGYKQKKAFQIVQQKFQQKIKRKIDHTLMARNLAIGNRAKSFLTIYQQQVQYESKLKMLRTKREVEKYEQQLEAIKNAVERNQEEEEEKQYYERVFQKITDEQEITPPEEKRYEMVGRLKRNFDSMFEQFYQRAAYKDHLHGLTDEQIKSQIMASPQKIKRQSRQLMKYLKKKGGVSINQKGELKVSDALSDKMKEFILSSPLIKIALLNEEIGYESPHNEFNRESIQEAKNRLVNLRKMSPDPYSQEDLEIIKENKLKDYEKVIAKEIPNDIRSYRLFESSEERLLRLEIKYYEMLIKKGIQLNSESENSLKDIINKFRRLKFRMEKRHKVESLQELAFPEHYEIEDWKQIEEEVEYEELIDYLRKKGEDRRLKAVDQVDDNKINEIIKEAPRRERPHSQGQRRKL